MRHFELWIYAITLVGLVLGAWGIIWARCSKDQGRTWLGRGIVVITFIAVGSLGLVAALYRTNGVIFLGLVTGFLLVGMLWEAPLSVAPIIEEV